MGPFLKSYHIYLCPNTTLKDIIHHLCTQGCTECNGNFPNCQEVFTDGSGVDDADIVIYVSADPDPPCGPTSGVLAFAGSCQLEAMLDRYVRTCAVSSLCCSFRAGNYN